MRWPKTITGGDAVNGRDGFSARVMWRRDGRGQAYVPLHMPSHRSMGMNSTPEAFRFVPGKPVAIRMQVVMNHAGQRDGSLRVWADDRPWWGKEPATGVRARARRRFAAVQYLRTAAVMKWAPITRCVGRFSRFQVQRMP
ncbi:MAG: hypothetical protein IPK32_26400 [Verrucomicrobiaceae bacterium]|nr:hypothetical protein [Verrucomicrobiaceae bacterium]